jgi:hypothetical protein
MSYMVTLSGRSLLLDFNLHIRGIQAAIDEALRLSLRLYQGAPVEFLTAMQIAPFLARCIQNQRADDNPLTFLEELCRCGVEPMTFTARDRPYEVADCSGSPSINEYFGANVKNKEMMSKQSQIVLGIGEKSVEIRDNKTLGVASNSVRVDETKGWYLLQYFGRCRQGVGEGGLGLIFTSLGAMREFGAKLRIEEQRLDQSDTYADCEADKPQGLPELILLAQEANHQCCLREFLGSANSGNGTGVCCPDVPCPGANWCPGCLNK